MAGMNRIASSCLPGVGMPRLGGFTTTERSKAAADLLRSQEGQALLGPDFGSAASMVAYNGPTVMVRARDNDPETISRLRERVASFLANRGMRDVNFQVWGKDSVIPL